MFLATPALASFDRSERVVGLDAEVEHFATASAPRMVGTGGVHSLFYGETPDDFILSVGGWWARLHGPISFGSDTIADVSETFGLDARTFVPVAQAAWRIGSLELTFEGTWYENEGLALLSESFEIDGVEFEVGDTVDSKIKFHTYSITFAWAFLRREAITLSFQLGLGVMYTAGRVTAINSNATARWDQWLPLPLIGVAARGYIFYPWIYDFEVGWIGIDLGTFGARALDIKAAVGYEVNDWVNFKIGYRYLGINTFVNEVSADIDLSGFYVELAVLF